MVFATRSRFDKKYNSYFQDTIRGCVKGGSKVYRDGSIESFVHVLDVITFKRSLGMKQVDTEAKWERFRASN